MKLRQSMGGLLALAVVLSAGLGSVRAEEEVHTHTWRTDWVIDGYHHWRGCTDPACRTLVPSQAEGYGYHIYDNNQDASCNVCGWVRAVDPGHTHTWGTGWRGDNTSHWNECSDPDCPGVVPGWAEGYARHVYGDDQDTTCDVCGWSRLTAAGHTHTWTETWSGNRQEHWRACGAPYCPGVAPGEGKDHAPHVYSGSQDPDCDVCGRNRYLNPDHTHIWGTEWNGDDACHWRRCAGADCPGVAPGQAEGYGAHVYTDSQAAVCGVCGRNRYVNPSHTHVWGTAWSGDGTHHWYACVGAGCPGVVPGEGEGYEEHVYDNSLDPDCNICGRLRVALPDSDGSLNRPAEPDSSLVKTGRGQVTIRPLNPKEGSLVTVILTPEEHYTASALTVTLQNGGTVEAARAGAGTWSFVQPGEQVKLHAVFLPGYAACARDGSCLAAVYSDLAPDQWYHDGIHYCLDWGLMSGYDPARFAPDGGLSGGMVAQILYNMAGHPEIPGQSGYESTDLWYDKAMEWAVGAGVMNASEGQRFLPEADVTREQLAVMLWRCAASPAVSGWSRAFQDAGSVTPWMEEAVRWAVDRGILCGREDGRLDPGGGITRAEAAAMLVRFHADNLLLWNRFS